MPSKRQKLPSFWHQGLKAIRRGEVLARDMRDTREKLDEFGDLLEWHLSCPFLCQGPFLMNLGIQQNSSRKADMDPLPIKVTPKV